MKVGSLHKVLGLFLIVFSSFSNHVVLPISPSAVFWFLGVVLMVLFFQKSLKSNDFSILLVVFSLYLLSTQIILGAPINRVLGLVLSFSFLPLVITFGDQISLQKLFDYSSKFINFSILLLVVEFVLRIVYPVNKEAVERLHQFEGHESLWIYQYKVSSFMYADSNGTAIHIIIILFFLVFLQNKFRVKFFYIKFTILFCLMFLTFSRAGILAMFGGLFYRYLYYEKPLSYKVFIWFISLFIGTLGVFYLLKIFRDDPSFQSKFVILNHFFNYLVNVDFWQLLLGIGITKSIDLWGIYAHNYFLTFFVETGLIGLAFQLFIFMKIIRKSSNTLIVLVPFFLAVLSSVNMYVPYLLVAIAIICLLDKKNAENQYSL